MGKPDSVTRGLLVLTHCPALLHNQYSFLMAAQNPPSVKSVRQSVTLPATLAVEAEAKARLRAAYKQFIGESDLVAKDIAGHELIRSIFGNGSIAEAPVR